MFMTTTKLLKELILSAQTLGLTPEDLMIAQEFLDNHEYGLCFDTIATQLYEYDIEIDEDFYSLIMSISRILKLEQNDYAYMKELIRSPNQIPTSVKENLSKIIGSLTP
jgi:L-serine deaminase